jgi:hypothetical protein
MLQDDMFHNVPIIAVMDFGIDCTVYSSLIRNKLKLVKHVVGDMTRPSMDVVPLIKIIN